MLSAPALALAQPADQPADSHRKAHGTPGDEIDEIIVSGHPPTDFGILASATSIEGDTLIAQTRGQIGDTLSGLPGISSTSFAPGASRPIIRGLGGDRVAILLDGIGSIDASNVSVDHAVVFDPLTVDHIDIFHGPAVLLYGSNTIGGAVNALDKRIPRQVPDTIGGTAILTFGSAADERAAGAVLEIPLADKLALHVDASWRKSNDLRVGGFVHAPALRDELRDEVAEHVASGERDEAEEFNDLANLSGRVPNTGSESSTLGAGIAFVDSRGDFGVSVQRFDTRYGVPLRPGAGHHHGPETSDAAPLESSIGAEAESVSIDLEQTRIDVRGSLNFEGLLESLQFRGAYGDYEHIEFEGDEVGTRFAGDGIELRVDAVQADRGKWHGRSGVQYFERSLAIEGEEAFVPDYSVERFGVFTLQAVQLSDAFSVELAGRYEKAKVRSGEADFSRSFDLWSGAAGLTYRPAENWTLGLNFIRGARAPTPEELLPNGIHIATQAFEVGNRGFSIEKSTGFEAYVKFDSERATFALTGYHTDFDGFIGALPTGLEDDGFPVFRFTQLPATFYGFEASGSFEPLSWSVGELVFDGSADYTHARFDGVGPVPRIPPLRIKAGGQVRHSALRLRTEIEWNNAQRRVAAFADPVGSFTLVNLGVDWHPGGEDGPVTLMLNAENIFDVIGRRAASFTSDFVPIPGRDIRLTARIEF